MRHPSTSQIAVDDISIGSRMTVLRNRGEGRLAPCGSEINNLKGSVLQVTAISLPYMLVQAFDPVRGRAKLTIDVRQHLFGKVDGAYSDAIIRSSGDVGEEKQCPPQLFPPSGGSSPPDR